MIIVDTSVWIEVLRDKSGLVVERFKEIVGINEILFCRFVQLELLQGAKDEHEWKKLDEYLETQYYLEAGEKTWRQAAFIYFDLRRRGLTIRSPIDCCIAQIAIENKVSLVHHDQDFVRIKDHFPLDQILFEV
jgi:predicted nucleic acid-binding protein